MRPGQAAHQSQGLAQGPGQVCGLGSLALRVTRVRPAVRALEAFAAVLDGGDELGEVDLEGAEDLVGVVLGAQANLALLGTGVVDEVLRRELGPDA